MKAYCPFQRLWQPRKRQSWWFCHFTGDILGSLKVQYYSQSPLLGWINFWCSTPMLSVSGREINPSARTRNQHSLNTNDLSTSVIFPKTGLQTHHFICIYNSLLTVTVIFFFFLQRSVNTWVYQDNLFSKTTREEAMTPLWAYRVSAFPFWLVAAALYVEYIYYIYCCLVQQGHCISIIILLSNSSWSRYLSTPDTSRLDYWDFQC